MSRNESFWRAKLILGLLLPILFLGCGSKLTRENYDRVQPGMTRSQVMKIMGEPWVRGERTLIYESPHVFAAEFVFDENDRLVRKEWTPVERARPDSAR